MNNYALNQNQAASNQKNTLSGAVKKLWPLMKDEKKNLIFASIAIFLNSLTNLMTPVVVAYAIDHYIQNKDYKGVLFCCAALFCMYLVGLSASYCQTRWMGGVGQRVLFNLRNAVFNKLQELPVAFFNQNKTGDLISRINNDTDKLNQFFSQSLMQFIGNFFIMAGAAICLLVLNIRLGIAALLPMLAVYIFTKIISPWVKRKNAVNMQALGNLSSEVQESLQNFKVIIAFNRRDYFRKRFDEANKQSYQAAVGAGLANNIFTPVYTLSSQIAQLIVLTLGIYLISTGNFTVGLLIGFFAYVNNFYTPLRQLAALWANFQVALAGWNRIAEILNLQNDLAIIPAEKTESNGYILEFRNISFKYPDGKEVLKNIDFKLEPGKTYALVGPTGGGKTTTASLMARLYDVTEGTVVLDGMDIRSYAPDERTEKIGFILQEPFIFTGTVRDNIVYGNEKLKHYTNEQLEEALRKSHLEVLLDRFEKGLDTAVINSGDGISLGQKQLIAFIRTVLRNPEILILDEATANIDTVTEKLLEDILKKLPKETTRIIIAHRLNTIENADDIFFINNGEVIEAGSLQDAVNMLLHGKRVS